MRDGYLGTRLANTSILCVHANWLREYRLRSTFLSPQVLGLDSEMLTNELRQSGTKLE